MHRSVILDFLSTYRQQLNKCDFKCATISLLGRFNLKEISGLLLRADEIVTYHVNEPRIYEKTYSFDTFGETICDMAVFTKQPVYLKKDDLSSIKDPFYLKDIREIDFYSLVILPIIKKEDVVATLIFYFGDDCKSINFKQSDLLRLYEKLLNAQGKTYDQEVDKAIFDNEDYIKIIYLKDKSVCYVDNYLKNKFHFKTNVISLENKQILRKIEREISQKKYRNINTKIFSIYYINQYDYKNSNDNLTLQALPNLVQDLNDKFSLIIVDGINIDEELDTLFPSSKISKYFIKDNFYVYYIDQEINTKNSLEICNKHLDEYILVLTTKSITSKMDIMKVLNYVCELRPTNFSFSDYVLYVNTINNINLNSDVFVSYHNDLTFVNSLTNEIFGTLPKMINFDINTNTLKEEYVESVFKLINNIIKNQIPNYIIPVIPSMLTSKRIYLALTKLQETNLHVKLLLTIPTIDKNNISDLEKNLSKLKKQGIYVFVDSSIYFNNKTIYLLDLCDGIYIHEDEYNMFVKYPGGINTAIYQYMVKNYKEVIINYPIEKVKDAYFNNLFYYLK